jgi:hypothetical protein
MRRSNRELWVAFFAVLGITTLYLFMMVMLNGIPNASGFFGHMIGVLGFILMLLTETLYTLRKRSRSARWGRMSEWLNFHIFTGIVGPYMVLLHTSWKFNGLAGVTLLLTIIVVASGFVGRYIYTAVPRTADGVEVEAIMIEGLIRDVEFELQGWLKQRPELARSLGARLATSPQLPQNSMALIVERSFLDWQQRLNWWRTKQRLEPNLRNQVEQMEELVRKRNLLRRQYASLAMARRLLALWHAVHIPIGMALFTAAFIHIGAAIYYATLLR